MALRWRSITEGHGDGAAHPMARSGASSRRPSVDAATARSGLLAIQRPHGTAARCASATNANFTVPFAIHPGCASFAIAAARSATPTASTGIQSP